MHQVDLNKQIVKDMEEMSITIKEMAIEIKENSERNAECLRMIIKRMEGRR